MNGPFFSERGTLSSLYFYAYGLLSPAAANNKIVRTFV